MQEKINEIKVYGSSSLADQAREDLASYTSLLAKDQLLQDQVKALNPKLVKEAGALTRHDGEIKGFGISR